MLALRRQLLLRSITFLTLGTAFVSGQNWLIGSLIPFNYNQTQPPLVNGHVYVNGSVVILRFNVASDQRSLDIVMDLCLKWHDYRLLTVNQALINITGVHEIPHYTSIRSTEFSHFWQPKLLIRNGLSTSVVESVNKVEYVEVMPATQMINLCRRMNLKLICKFDLQQFPFDAQECPIEVESAGNSVQHLKIRLSVETKRTYNNQMRLHHAFNGSCQHRNSDQLTKPVASAQADSCAYVSIRLVRHLSYYIIRYYCPTFLCLVTSFNSFWVATNGWPARVILTAVVYLTLKPISETAYREVPAPDVVPLFWWLWVIQGFIYMNLIEYATALAWVQFAQAKTRAHAANIPSPDGHYFGKKSWFAAGGHFLDNVLYAMYGHIDYYRDPAGRNKVDYVARLVYPSIMFFFVLIYIVATIPRWAVLYL